MDRTSMPRLTGVGTTVLTLLLVSASSWAGPPKRPEPPDRMRVKPDLVVSSFSAAKTGLRSDGTNLVRLTVKVGLGAMGGASTGPFKVRVEWRRLRTVDPRVKPVFPAYQLLREAGIAGMSSSPASGVIRLETRTFDDEVPSGESREYRVTVDSMDQVDEASEANNQATTTYEPRTCSGPDLVLTRVRVDGVVKVWVRNQCTTPCEGGISYGYDPLDTGTGGITQAISTRIGGEAEIGPVGTMMATRHMRVWVAVDSGPCRDLHPGNNTCVVELRPGETSRTFTCGH